LYVYLVKINKLYSQLHECYFRGPHWDLLHDKCVYNYTNMYSKSAKTPKSDKTLEEKMPGNKTIVSQPLWK